MPDLRQLISGARTRIAAVLGANFQRGLANHRQGRLAEAERVYRAILRRQPANFDALHMIGVLAVQTRRADEGATLIGRAIELNPDAAATHNNLGNALRALGRSAEALASYGRAIAYNPQFVEANSNRGDALNKLKRPLEALFDYEAAIALTPTLAEVHLRFEKSRRRVCASNRSVQNDLVFALNNKTHPKELSIFVSRSDSLDISGLGANGTLSCSNVKD